MKYSDFIKGNEEFQYSINVQYDLMNPLKIKSYIPTSNSIVILKEYLFNCIVDSRDKATVLIGPYGKGKSHLLLVLLAIMCGNKEIKEISSLISKIKIIDDECGDIAQDVLEKKKYLPVVLNFNSGDLNQAFLIGINQALKEAGIEDILPDTYFNVALHVVEQWEKYDKTICKFSKLVKKKFDISVDEFKKKLRSYNTDAYDYFKILFKEITSGVEFNPMINTDVVKLYEEINHRIKEGYNYDGIVIIFDEFSKFIESSETKNNTMDLKILQDLSELCNRSKSPQMHLICITHKTINEYISKIPQEKIDAWRSIEGRFKEIKFNSISQQNYELISNAVEKDVNVVSTILENCDEQLERHFENGKVLFDMDEREYNEKIVKGCFPLSPYTTFALPIISEKVAQNERTLFTYLSKDEPDSLINIINNDNGECNIVTIDKLYDYFESLFKKETFNENIYDIWVKVDTALKIVYSDLEKRIVKALGVIYIINDFFQLSPKEDDIRRSLNVEKSIFDEAIKSLRNTNILVLRKSSETLDFIPLSCVDINQKISSVLEAKFREPNCSKVLKKLVNLKYLLPKRYNDEYKMTRFFKRVFMSKNELTAYSSGEQLLEELNTDGVIVDLVYFNDDELSEVEIWKNRIADSRIILVIPKESNKIKEDISEYMAINYLRDDNDFLNQDAAIESQIDILYEDIVDKIIGYVNKNYDLSSGECTVYIKDRICSGVKSNILSKELSEICNINFGNSPIINNELINKNELSAPIKKARDTILSMILDDTYKTFEYNKNSAESTLFRATIQSKGLLNGEKSYSKDIKLVIDKIRNFVVSSGKKELCFEEIYNILISNKEGIGIRSGVLPIYLAFVLKDYKEEVIIYLKHGRKKKEVILDVGIINNINNNPKEYLIKVEEETKEKEAYLSKLSITFNAYLLKSSNNRYVDIINGMKSWLHSLSIYAQNHNEDIRTGNHLPDTIKKLRSSLVKFDINYRQFIFVEIPKLFGIEDYDETINRLLEIKEYLDRFDEQVINYLINSTNEIINKDYKGSLTGNLTKWYVELNEYQKSHLFDTTTDEFLKLCENISNNDKEIISKLAIIFTGLSLQDWHDNTVSNYLEELNKSKKLIEEYEVAVDKNESLGSIKIILNDDSSMIEKSFNKKEVSSLGAMLKNTIEESIDEYGDSIDDNEKRNILMEILSSYI